MGPSYHNDHDIFIKTGQIDDLLGVEWCVYTRRHEYTELTRTEVGWAVNFSIIHILSSYFMLTSSLREKARRLSIFVGSWSRDSTT